MEGHDRIQTDDIDSLFKDPVRKLIKQRVREMEDIIVSTATVSLKHGLEQTTVDEDCEKQSIPSPKECLKAREMEIRYLKGTISRFKQREDKFLKQIAIYKRLIEKDDEYLAALERKELDQQKHIAALEDKMNASNASDNRIAFLESGYHSTSQAAKQKDVQSAMSEQMSSESEIVTFIESYNSNNFSDLDLEESIRMAEEIRNDLEKLQYALQSDEV